MSESTRCLSRKCNLIVFGLVASILVNWIGGGVERSNAAEAADPLVAGSTFTFRDIRTPTQTGFFIGDRIAVGVLDVFPNPETGLGGIQTEVTASQADVSTTLEFFGGALGVQYVNSVPFQPSLTGSFEISITNPGSINSPLVVTSPVLGATSLVPFATDGQITPNGRTPRISWVVPSSIIPDSIRVFIFDLSRQAQDGSALVIHAENLLATSTFFDVPAILDSGDSLQIGGRYEITIMLQKNRADGSLLSRSRRFYQFSPIPNGPVQELPSVGPDNVFSFDFDATKQSTFILDPPRAVGYRYTIVTGNPKFGSIRLLSDFGSDYKLSFRDGAKKVVKKLAPGEVFDFSQFQGVKNFDVRLLRPNFKTDSELAKLFLSEVSFITNGMLNARFTGSMTPIFSGKNKKQRFR